MKATSTEKLERVKSFPEAGRKLFGGPGSGPNKGGESEGGGADEEKQISTISKLHTKFPNGISSKDVENIIHDDKVFKGENHSRAKLVLNSLSESKGDMNVFKDSPGGRLYIKMPQEERAKIHSAINRYLSPK